MEQVLTILELIGAYVFMIICAVGFGVSIGFLFYKTEPKDEEKKVEF